MGWERQREGEWQAALQREGEVAAMSVEERERQAAQQREGESGCDVDEREIEQQAAQQRAESRARERRAGESGGRRKWWKSLEDSVAWEWKKKEEEEVEAVKHTAYTKIEQEEQREKRKKKNIWKRWVMTHGGGCLGDVLMY